MDGKPNASSPLKGAEQVDHPQVKLWHRFVCGGIGDMTAACVSHPFDVIKVRRQIQGELQATTSESLFSLGKQLLEKEGILGLYQGLSASLLRQFLFSSNRHGFYGVILYYYHQNKEGSNRVVTTDKYQVTLTERIAAGVTAGAGSALLANPADVVLVRMQSDGSKPLHQRRNYKHAFHGIQTIVREEGLLQLWRGCWPTVIRATLVTSAQMAGYDTSKNFLKSTGLFKNESVIHFVASVMTAFCASFVTAPVDLVKTRVMNNLIYKGAWDCLRCTVKTEGLWAMWKGLVPAFVRLAPHNVVLWLTMERVQKHLEAQ